MYLQIAIKKSHHFFYIFSKVKLMKICYVLWYDICLLEREGILREKTNETKKQPIFTVQYFYYKYLKKNKWMGDI
jgi:hypothetical protein